MDTKLKRAKPTAKETSTIGRTMVAGSRPEVAKSRRSASRRDSESISFSLADLINTRISIVSKGVVVRPPRPPKMVVEMTFELPVDDPRC